MLHIPIENFSIPTEISEPFFLTKNGADYAAFIPAQQFKEQEKLAKLASLYKAMDAASTNAEENGLTDKILEELLSDIS